MQHLNHRFIHSFMLGSSHHAVVSQLIGPVTQYQCYMKYFYSHGTLSYFNEVFHSGQKSHELVLALFGIVVLPPRLTAATVQRHRPFPLRALLKAASSVGGAKPNVVVVDWLHIFVVTDASQGRAGGRAPWCLLLSLGVTEM